MKQARTRTEKRLKMVLAHGATRCHAARDRAIVMVSFQSGLWAKETAAIKSTDARNDDATSGDAFVLAQT